VKTPSPAEVGDIAAGLVTTYMGEVCPPDSVGVGSRMPINVLELLLSTVCSALCDCSNEEECAMVLQRTWQQLANRISERDKHLPPHGLLLGPTTGPMQ
jgi:hypothetical protein